MLKHLRPMLPVVLAFLALTLSGCSNKGAQEAAGVGMVELGKVVASLPHPVARVVGAFLITAGTALIVEAELASGEVQQFEFQLTEDQQKTLEAGGEVEVVDPSGKTIKVKPSKQ